MVNYYVLGVTIFWIIIGAVLPIFAKGSNQGYVLKAINFYFLSAC